MSDERSSQKTKAHTLMGLVIGSLARWILVPLITGLIAAIFTGRVINRIVQPLSYKIYMIGPLGEDGTKQIWKAFSERKAELARIGEVPLEMESIDDQGDPVNAERISLGLAAKNDTLMVVGHVASTQTKAALPAYLLKADPPIPVILTTETNPNLLPPKTSPGIYYPVFHLSPTDDEQALTAAQLAIDQGTKACWVVEDTSNPVYSTYLAGQFVEQLQRRSVKVLLWSTNLTIPSVEAIQALKIDRVFFAGEWRSALVLTRSLRAMFPNPTVKTPGLILSDWSVDERLIDHGGDDTEGVYLVHALTARAFADGQFGGYGKDAFKLVKQLVEDANVRFDELAGAEDATGFLVRRALGLRRVRDARNALIAVMREAVKTGRKFDLDGGTKGMFKEDGTRADASFHIWTVKNHRFVDSP
jgi:branched-chain amino acid transport system substrate-binding protein